MVSWRAIDARLGNGAQLGSWGEIGLDIGNGMRDGSVMVAMMDRAGSTNRLLVDHGIGADGLHRGLLLGNLGGRHLARISTRKQIVGVQRVQFEVEMGSAWQR